MVRLLLFIEFSPIHIPLPSRLCSVLSSIQYLPFPFTPYTGVISDARLNEMVLTEENKPIWISHKNYQGGDRKTMAPHVDNRPTLRISTAILQLLSTVLHFFRNRQ